MSDYSVTLKPITQNNTMLLQWLKKNFRKTSKHLQKNQQLKLVTCQIHGSHYYECMKLVRTDHLHKGEELFLVRESNNEYDNNAIEIFNDLDIKLGYVPKMYNPIIAELMDQQCKISAIVRLVEPEAWEPVTISIFMKLR